MKDNELILPNGKMITLNPDQIEGINQIKEWLTKDATKHQFFTLGGYAGTGKSTCIKKFIDTTKLRKIVVSAPTHKAKNVISKATGLTALTLHSLLGLRPDVMLDEFNPNAPQFNPIATPTIHKYNLIIIDEASMINLSLFEMIERMIANTHIRVLFMGDMAQTPPVGEAESVVFSKPYIAQWWLNKLERQSDTNPLLDYYTLLRNNLRNPTGGFERTSSIHILPDGTAEGIAFTNSLKVFGASIVDKFISDEFSRNREYVKVIAWRNEIVLSLNKSIRAEIFKNNPKYHFAVTDIVEVGDILTGYRAVSGEVAGSFLIENSSDYTVVGKSMAAKKNKYGVNTFDVTLADDERRIKVHIVNSEDVVNLHRYASVHDTLKREAKADKTKWSKYYEFRRVNLIMTTIATYADGKSRKSEDVIAKDLDYAYAITAHKSQGSTYQHIAVIEDDIYCNPKVKERNQIEYVALTRASKSVLVYSTQTQPKTEPNGIN